MTKPTFSPKRQWSPAVPLKFRNLGGQQKNFFGAARPPQTLDEVSATAVVLF